MSWIGATIYKIRVSIREAKIKSRFKRKLNKYPPIIVYQMGKVGSSSIYDSLKQFTPGVTLHRHELAEKKDWQAQFVLEHAALNKPVKLISLIREPVGRNISAFFQNFEFVTGISPENSKFSMEEIKNQMLTNPIMDNTVPLWWFDRNILEKFGIDVFARPFEKEKGWTTFKKNNIELLLMKCEISDELKTALIREFLNMPQFILSNSNVGESKDYAALYKEFKRTTTFPEEYLDMLYKATQVKHFYKDEEIDEQRKRWNKK